MQRKLFNPYHQDGKVCFGTVTIQIPRECRLEEFMRQWEIYFFNSFFSHTLGIIGNVCCPFTVLAKRNADLDKSGWLNQPIFVVTKEIKLCVFSSQEPQAS
ncbi:hypothetical protein [Mucilaginibacter gilvus]|uniref:Uncharacterized protein n=1 Tax=Mucilaginibacter gilvus TaxID=2305909 RepID=A0A444MQG2_9SPHI|nr:hypothetical protein EPL05_07325 [Mucilaginibacter gilvus]